MDAVTYQAVGGVAHIELNRPEVSNSVDLVTARALGEAVGRAADDSTLRVLLLTGAGTRFCAGGDVASMAAAADRSAYVEELASTLDASLQLLAGVEKPVVAGVQGAVAGAGLALMLSCDVVVAGASTRFVTAYAGVGLTPDCGLSWLLPRAVGQQRALELLLTGRVLTAQEAQDWGLVTMVVPDDEVAGRALETSAGLSAGPASALGLARGLVRRGWQATRADVGAEEAKVIGRAVASPEAERLLEEFLGR